MSTVFTDEQINEILQLINSQTAHQQYIGARYVPIFGRKGETSIEWDGGAGTYEPLTIVLYQGNSYTSRQFVPAGIQITNTEFWANTGNYNAQIEQYRQDVSNVTGQLSGIETALGNVTNQAATNKADIATNTAAIQANTTAIQVNTTAIQDNTAQIADNTANIYLAMATSRTFNYGYGTINAIIDCASTYFDAVKNGNLTYGDGIMANQAAGTISCSSFFWALMHGIPYSDFVFASATTTTKSGLMHRYGYRLLCDMDMNPVTLTAQDTYNYFKNLGLAYPTTDFTNVNVGDAIYYGSGVDGINHCALVIGFNVSKTVAYAVESSRSQEGPAPLSIGPKGNGLGITNLVGYSKLPLTPVAWDAKMHPISINLDTGKIQVAPTSSRASLCTFVTIEYECTANSPVTITIDNGSSIVVDSSFTNSNDGKGSITIFDFYGTFINVSGVKWFNAYATDGYGYSDKVYLVSSEANLISFLKNTNSEPKMVFLNSAQNLAGSINYNIQKVNRAPYSSEMWYQLIGINNATLYVGSANVATATAFAKCTIIG